jgi:hypothetical protein
MFWILNLELKRKRIKGYETKIETIAIFKKF